MVPAPTGDVYLFTGGGRSSGLWSTRVTLTLCAVIGPATDDVGIAVVGVASKIIFLINGRGASGTDFETVGRLFSYHGWACLFSKDLVTFLVGTLGIAQDEYVPLLGFP